MMEFTCFSRWQGLAESGSTLLKVTTLLIVFTVTLLVYLLRGSLKEAPLPPGPRGLPLLGFLPFLKPDLHRCFADLAATYGPVFSLRLGSRLCIVLSSPAAAREALRDHDAIFASHDVPATASTSSFKGENILFLPYGPVWRTLRRVAVRELLSPATCANLYSMRRRAVRRMLEEVQGMTGQPVNLRELISATTINMLMSMMWGDTLEGELGALAEEFRALVPTYVQTLGEPNVSDFFPSLAWLDLQGLGRRMKRVSGLMDDIFDSIIQQQWRTLLCRDEHGEKSSEKKNFLQVVLELREKAEQQATLTMLHVKGLLLDLVTGGVDTASTTVEWVMAELLSNPCKMRKVKEDIAVIVSDDGAVEETHLSSLRYLVAVVKEVLRLHPVVPLLVPYRPSATCTIAGHRIPQGAKVFVNTWVIHRDPQVWKDASAFEPERFLHDQELDNTGNSFRYLPFGAGRKMCPGIALGEKMIVFMVASLLHKLDWNLPDGAKLDMSEQFGIVMRKRESLVAVPTPHVVT